MPQPAQRRRGWLPRLVAGFVATALALGTAELLMRWLLPAPRAIGELYYRDQEGTVRDPLWAVQHDIIVPVKPPSGAPPPPRPRRTFAPGSRFYLCYRDHEILKRDWFDQRGCVEVAFSRWGIREREEIGPDKPPGQKRVVCIGDSFTMGWGVRPEDTWVRLLEQELRQGNQDVRTVNCGGAGAIVADEYAWALEHRFAVFGPDVVVVTFCLNDLLPSGSALAHMRPPSSATGSVLVDRILTAVRPGRLDLDPAIDWVGLLMAEPKASPLYNDDAPFDAMWAQGTPQRALLSMQAFCRQRNLPLLVVVWPFLQGLGESQFYPFAKMHELVTTWCREQAVPIPCLDLLPALKGNRPENLWVTPSDMHANPRGHRLATPAIAAFVRAHLPQ